MRKPNTILLISALLLPAAAAIAAPAKAPERSGALIRVVDCRTIAAADERLACYDREVAALDAAEARRDIVVVDKEQMRKTRRTLFGLELPNLNIFGGGGDSADEEEFTQIEAKIKSVSQVGYGKWAFELEDGARWVQTDDKQLAIEPRPGQTITIKRAALGSYMARVKDRTIRVERLR